ncbi:efflux RND transporter periplasmic adaptor subunit [Thiocapsa bogorovii]|uniref:efflux RND transporter periplasmic adaptor subunit n=1 Tax=Thiocapsa bogorovii TaxID=521689 RepID=UPI001E58CDEF|nr:efflux RND transporter periplasmic adaptor subunit [Thiocapsa bogorovii]UHD17680.1 efflux RND transporter periplasmic adaptor subunit [Thiocapsa bogorovii]
MSRIGAICVAALLGSGCEPSQDASSALEALPDPESVPWVLSARVESAPNSVWTLTGTVRARHEIPLSFRIGGEIQERLVDAGAHVEAGDVLFRLDPRDVKQQRLAAEATVASARAESENAERERERLDDLLTKRLASEQDHDRAVTAARAAEQRLLAAEASLEQARNATRYADLLAPATGVILDVEGQVGQVVSPSQAVARLAEDGPREIEVQVPESRRVGLPPEATAQLGNGPVDRSASAASGGSAPVQVTLREIAGSADPLSRTWRARYRLPDLPAEPGLGTTVTLTFETAREASGPFARVPLGAVLERGEGPLIWRIEEGRVEPEPIELIGIVGEQAEIRTDLAPGTAVVALGAHLLLPGQAVQVLER